jgi:hypothetical protein
MTIRLNSICRFIHCPVHSFRRIFVHDVESYKSMLRSSSPVSALASLRVSILYMNVCICCNAMPFSESAYSLVYTKWPPPTISDVELNVDEIDQLITGTRTGGTGKGSIETWFVLVARGVEVVGKTTRVSRGWEQLLRDEIGPTCGEDIDVVSLRPVGLTHTIPSS